MIRRKTYLNKIQKYINLNLVKIITGQRRAGKTYFLRQIIDFIKKEMKIPSKNIIYINKEDLKFEFIKDYADLYKFIEHKTKKINGKVYLFVDEIQDIQDWERVIRNYVLNKKFDIYITGSNSNLLSGELASMLTGRYVQFHIYPLNFKEFLEFRQNKKQEIEKEFKNYLKYGGLPAIHKMDFDDEIIFSYIQGTFNSILYKDIISRYKIRNPGVLQDIVKFLFDNIGNILSTKKIIDYFKKEKIFLSLDTLRDYLVYFENSFLIYKVKRYDLRGKKILDLYEKYYVGDLGFKHFLLGFRQSGIGQNLENLVYLELLNRGYEVLIGKIDNLEIDFIAKKNGKIKYIQVCYLLGNKETIRREFGNLLKIKDNYKKIVLSLDKFFQSDYEGIKHYYLIDWILDNKD